MSMHIVRLNLSYFNRKSPINGKSISEIILGLSKKCYAVKHLLAVKDALSRCTTIQGMDPSEKFDCFPTRFSPLFKLLKHVLGRYIVIGLNDYSLEITMRKIVPEEHHLSRHVTYLRLHISIDLLHSFHFPKNSLDRSCASITLFPNEEQMKSHGLEW